MIKHIRRWAFAAAAAAFAAAASAQTPHQQTVEAFRRHLESPVRTDSLHMVYNTVKVTEEGDVHATVRAAENSANTDVNGYRIVIFMSNTQSARADAFAVRESFGASFPDERSYLSYENLYFKVVVGNCASQEDAVILLNRIKHEYPKAFITRETIPAAEFIPRREQTAAAEQ